MQARVETSTVAAVDMQATIAAAAAVAAAAAAKAAIHAAAI